MSFKIKAGEKIGLVGMNGAGKSTLIKLLCGLIRPTSGYIRINGVDITSMERTECYKLFSTVFQDLHIFPVSIKDNIVWDGQVDEACFAQCLEQADLAEWVSSIKEKENTKLVQELEEGAVNLSGGQSQKLLLARALYKNAPILLLDEPTAALILWQSQRFLRNAERSPDQPVRSISHIAFLPVALVAAFSCSMMDILSRKVIMTSWYSKKVRCTISFGRHRRSTIHAQRSDL